jgi:type II secretory pathway component HofQ
MNVVVDSKVQGTVTLKLDKVPWEQGLDLVLKTNNLDKRQVGNTLVIATKEVITKNFDVGLTKTYPLRYAKAADMAPILTALLGRATAGEISVQVWLFPLQKNYSKGWMSFLINWIDPYLR